MVRRKIAVQVFAQGRRHIHRFEREIIHSELFRQPKRRRPLFLIVVHDDKPEGQERRGGSPPFFRFDYRPDIFQNQREIPAPPILPIGLVRRSVYAEHQAVQTGIHQEVRGSVAEFDIPVSAGMQHDIFRLGIGYHFEQSGIQKRFAPIPEHDQEQIITVLVDEILEFFVGENAFGARAVFRRREAERTGHVAEVGRFHLADDRVPERFLGKDKLVAAGLEKVSDFLGGEILDFKGDLLEFEFQPPAQQKIRDLGQDIAELE